MLAYLIQKIRTSSFSAKIVCSAFNNSPENNTYVDAAFDIVFVIY